MNDWTQPAGRPPGPRPPGFAPPVGPPPGGAPPPGAPPWQPVDHPTSPMAYPPASQFSGPMPVSSAPPVSPPRRRSWPAVLALVLVAMLTVAFGLQTWQLHNLSTSLERANEQLTALGQEQAYGGERLDALEDRAGELERLAGEVFNSEAVAASVLPSVFKVVAGPFSGTAFAIGTADDDGNTNLFTNYHVVEEVWERGDRQVSLERANQRYQAEIVDVDADADVAWLRTGNSFKPLAASTDDVRSGQPIIAVGAPLGLTDTVTTGVVSSPAQQLPDGSGPWIQFDAAINPGNSGGPVINSAQEVVGIATAKRAESEGLGFAVPIEVACSLFDIC